MPDSLGCGRLVLVVGSWEIMRRLRRILGLLLVLIIFSWAAPSSSFGWGEVSEDTEGMGEEERETAGLWDGLWVGFGRLFRPVSEVVSPVPLQLTKGIKPLPEPLFGGEEEEGGLPATSFFIQERSKDYSVYSLDGDFASPTGKSGSGGREDAGLAAPRDRGEVWGTRIAEGEREVGSWFQDSGVMLALLGTVGITVLVAVFLIGRRIWLRT